MLNRHRISICVGAPHEHVSVDEAFGNMFRSAISGDFAERSSRLVCDFSQAITDLRWLLAESLSRPRGVQRKRKLPALLQAWFERVFEPDV